HFDNVGLYSLVERGCKYIVVSDSSEDLHLCFSDLGEAIRRCRIDFGTEITLDITPLRRREQNDVEDEPVDHNQAPVYHYVVGSISESRAHAESLGWKPPAAAPGVPVDPAADDYRKGVIVYFKPSVTVQVPADVRQYGFQNTRFPHQSNMDQWFDEGQFESYRKLGEECAKQAFAPSPLSTLRDVPLTYSGVSGFFDALRGRAEPPARSPAPTTHRPRRVAAASVE